jgi:hypothetical protein
MEGREARPAIESLSKRRDEGESLQALARSYGVAHPTIIRARRGDTR